MLCRKKLYCVHTQKKNRMNTQRKTILESVLRVILLCLVNLSSYFLIFWIIVCFLDKAASRDPSQQVEACLNIAPEPGTPPSPPAPAASSCWTGKSGCVSLTPRSCASAGSRDKTCGQSSRWCCSCSSRRRWSCCLPGRCCMKYGGSCFPDRGCECRKDCSRRCCWRSVWKHCLFSWISPKTEGGSDLLPLMPIFPPNDEAVVDPKGGSTLCRPEELLGSCWTSTGRRRWPLERPWCGICRAGDKGGKLML